MEFIEISSNFAFQKWINHIKNCGLIPFCVCDSYNDSCMQIKIVSIHKKKSNNPFKVYTKQKPHQDFVRGQIEFARCRLLIPWTNIMSAIIIVNQPKSRFNATINNVCHLVLASGHHSLQGLNVYLNINDLGFNQ